MRSRSNLILIFCYTVYLFLQTLAVLLWAVVAAVVAKPQDAYGQKTLEDQLVANGPSVTGNLDNTVSKSQVGPVVQELVRAGRAVYGGNQGGSGPSAPARYNFQWDVNDQPSGNFYGHGEERDGANTQGK